MICKRCHEECTPSHLVTSDVISLEVCDECTVVAVRLTQITPVDAAGVITIKPIREARE